MKKIIIVFLLIIFNIINLSGCITVYAKDKKLNIIRNNLFTVNKAVRQALKNNDLIKSAAQKVKSAQANFNAATAGMLPKLTFNYNATRLEYQPYLATPHNQIPVFTGSGAKNGYMYFPPRIYMNSIANFNWNAEITQPIFTGFALLDKRELAELGIDISKVQKREAVLNVIEGVKIAYFNVLRMQEQVKVADEQVKSLKSHEMQAKLLYKQGVIPYNDLLKSEVALADAVQYKALSKTSLNTAISNFNTVLNQNINEEDRFKNINYVSFKKYRLDNLFNYALNHRPGLKIFGFKIKQASLKEGMANSRYYPQVSAFAAYSQSGQNWLASSNEFSNQANKIIGLSATWTLFNWFKTSDNYQKERHDKMALKYDLKSYLNNVRLEVKSNLLDLITAYKNIKTAKLSVRQAEENLKITNLQYMQETTTSTEVLDAETYLKHAELNYYDSIYGYDIYLAKLQRAIGRNIYGK
ncbi:MAG: TolC family protein [bacterium]|jgi:outer membrane protein TolC